MISLKKPFKFIIYSLMLVVTPLFSQQLSEEDFSKRLDEERGNYSVQNYNASKDTGKNPKLPQHQLYKIRKMNEDLPCFSFSLN